MGSVLTAILCIVAGLGYGVEHADAFVARVAVQDCLLDGGDGDDIPPSVSIDELKMYSI